jgi:septum site-determining protein MinD
MPRIVAILSNKGGVGKTSTTINLGTALTYFTRDTLIVDANISSPSIGINLGSPSVPIALNHVLRGSHSLDEAIYHHKTGLKVVPSSLKFEDFDALSMENLRKHLSSSKSDIVLLDSAPGINHESLSALKAADEVLVITNPNLSSVASSLKTIKLAQRHGKEITGVIVTRAGHHTDMSIKEIESMLHEQVIGIIPEDSLMHNSLKLSQPLVEVSPNSPASIAYKQLAAALTGMNYVHR